MHNIILPAHITWEAHLFIYTKEMTLLQYNLQLAIVHSQQHTLTPWYSHWWKIEMFKAHLGLVPEVNTSLSSDKVKDQMLADMWWEWPGDCRWWRNSGKVKGVLWSLSARWFRMSGGGPSRWRSTLYNGAEGEGMPFTVEEVEATIAKLKNGKSPGVCGISTEMLMAGKMIVVKWLHRIMSIAWDNREVPEDWWRVVMILVHKKGARRSERYTGV